MPDWAERCQFCHAELPTSRRKRKKLKVVDPDAKSLPWLFIVSYLVALYWITAGLVQAVSAYLIIAPMRAGVVLTLPLCESVLVATFGVLIGIGLASRTERSLRRVTFLSVVLVLFAVGGIAAGWPGLSIPGLAKVAPAVLYALQASMGALACGISHFTIRILAG